MRQDSRITQNEKAAPSPKGHGLESLFAMPQQLPPPTVLLNAHWQVRLSDLEYSHGQMIARFADKLARDRADFGTVMSRFHGVRLEGDEFVNADGSLLRPLIHELGSDTPVLANAVMLDANNPRLWRLFRCPEGDELPWTDDRRRRFMRLRGMAI